GNISLQLFRPQMEIQFHGRFLPPSNRQSSLSACIPVFYRPTESGNKRSAPDLASGEIPWVDGAALVRQESWAQRAWCVRAGSGTPANWQASSRNLTVSGSPGFFDRGVPRLVASLTLR